MSTIAGPGLFGANAGASAMFTITLKDQFGNERDQRDNLVLDISVLACYVAGRTRTSDPPCEDVFSFGSADNPDAPENPTATKYGWIEYGPDICERDGIDPCNEGTGT